VRYMLTVKEPAGVLKHYFDHHIKRLDVSLIMMIVGNRVLKFGVGKSYSAIRIGEIMDEDYRHGTDALVKIVHTPEDFRLAMKRIEEKKKKGQVLIIDEAGLLVNSRQWFSMINKAMGDVVMTFRVLKCIAIFVAPHPYVIDKNIRGFTNLLGVAEKILMDGRRRVRMTVYQMLWKDDKVGTFDKRIINMGVKSLGRTVRFKSFIVDKPHNKELLDAYEKKSEAFKRKSREEMQELEIVVKGADEYVSEAMKEEELIHDVNGRRRAYPEDIQEYFKISHRKAASVSRKMNALLLKEGQDDD
jgi:hypothetical protein